MYYRLGGRYEQLMTGELSVEDLDDEELARGQLKDKNGHWRGRPPKVIPATMVAAMRRELHSRAENTLREGLMGAIKGYTAIATNEELDPAVRLRAMDRIVERVIGKVPDKVVMAAEDPVEKMFRDVLNTAGGLLEEGEAPYEPTFEEREMLS